MSFTRFIIASGIFIRDKTVLLVANKWRTPDCTLPGGRIEPGEGVIEALKREFLEETGFKIRDVGRLCYVVQSSITSLKEEAFILAFRVTAVLAHPMPDADDLVQTIAFVPFEKVESLVNNPANAIPLVEFLKSRHAGVPFYYFHEADSRTQLKFKSNSAISPGERR